MFYKKKSYKILKNIYRLAVAETIDESAALLAWLKKNYLQPGPTVVIVKNMIVYARGGKTNSQGQFHVTFKLFELHILS